MEKDVFDYVDDDEEESEPIDRSALVWNILTVVVLLTTVCVGVLFLLVFVNPNIGFNPFPPPTLPVITELDTPTPTPKDVLPPTWTPTVTPLPTATNTPEPTKTTAPTQENQAENNNPPEGGNEQELGDMPVVLHEGSPQYIPATSFHPDLGCNWLGVAGQVIDINGAPVQGLIVELGGTLAGENIGSPTVLQATGLARAYGDAGYEMKLADGPINSSGSLWIQVLDQAGLPLSEKIYFYTFDDCQKNLIIIYFKQVQ